MEHGGSCSLISVVTVICFHLNLVLHCCLSFSLSVCSRFSSCIFSLSFASCVLWSCDSSVGCVFTIVIDELSVSLLFGAVMLLLSVDAVMSYAVISDSFVIPDSFVILGLISSSAHCFGWYGLPVGLSPAAKLPLVLRLVLVMLSSELELLSGS